MELFKIEFCKGKEGCPRGVGDTKNMYNIINNTFKETGFSKKRQIHLGKKPNFHHIFKVGIAGCANCCSQPQIKEFALVAKALPTINHDLCTLCGLCMNSCKEKALYLVDRKLVLNKAQCLGCGDCWRVCPEGAIVSGEVNWRLLIGGKLGRHPQLAKEIKEIKEEEVTKFLRKAIEIIVNFPNPQVRIGQILTEGFEVTG
ncbi:MAG: 4Fe-4S dicluster domain-containing protein [Peptococcales bacterium]